VIPPPVIHSLRLPFLSAPGHGLCLIGETSDPLSAVGPGFPPPPAADVRGLVERHFGLVRQVLLQVGRRLPAHVDRTDLFGAGTEALLDAARRFEPGRGIPFPAFAAKRVRGAMLDEMRRWDWAARSVRSDAHRAAEAVESLEARFGREPSTAEVATVLGMSADRFRRARADTLGATVLSLDAVIAAGSHRLPAAATTPPDILIAREADAHLRDAVDTLPDRERHAIAGYYLDERPMRELARELGVGESRVSQLCSKGLKHLHENLARYVLDDGAATRPRTRRRDPG
jgi:RNA polymerase sigma factor for flagellar operon FliA